MISQSILDILSESGRKNWFTFQLLDKNENIKVEELKCIESFSMTYSCFSDIEVLQALIFMKIVEFVTPVI